MANNNSNSNQINVPEAREAMRNMKHEVANELGITLNQGYNGNISAKDAGHIGRACKPVPRFPQRGAGPVFRFGRLGKKPAICRAAFIFSTSIHIILTASRVRHSR